MSKITEVSIECLATNKGDIRCGTKWVILYQSPFSTSDILCPKCGRKQPMKITRYT